MSARTYEGPALFSYGFRPFFLLGSIYSTEYWSAQEHPDNGQRLRFFYGLLAASLATLVLARNSVTFLVGWEVMAVSAFFGSP